MNKITITLDVNKIPKDKIVERRYFDRENKEVAVKELKLDIIQLKEPKTIKEGADWIMKKTHFVAIPQSKEEREEGKKGIILGDGITFE